MRTDTQRRTCARIIDGKPCGNPVPVLRAPEGYTGVVLKGTEIPLRYCDVCHAIVDAEERAAQNRTRSELLLSRAGGGEMFREWSFDTYPDDLEEVRKAKRIALAWLDDVIAGTANNFLIFGSIGSGKSGLAWALVREACERGHDAVFMNWRDYLWDLRQSYRDPDWQVNTRGRFASLLALDDLGLERPTEHAREELSHLIFRRAERRLPLIVTSNFDPAELAARLGRDDLREGRRIVSRLVQHAVQFRFEGPDRRLA